MRSSSSIPFWVFNCRRRRNTTWLPSCGNFERNRARSGEAGEASILLLSSSYRVSGLDFVDPRTPLKLGAEAMDEAVEVVSPARGELGEQRPAPRFGSLELVLNFPAAPEADGMAIKDASLPGVEVIREVLVEGLPDPCPPVPETLAARSGLLHRRTRQRVVEIEKLPSEPGRGFATTPLTAASSREIGR